MNNIPVKWRIFILNNIPVWNMVYIIDVQLLSIFTLYFYTVRCYKPQQIKKRQLKSPGVKDEILLSLFVERKWDWFVHLL